jgi:fission process protein 1
MSNVEHCDILRQAPFRYLGYCNEIGESLRPLVPLKVVIATYIVSGIYVLSDSFLIGMKSYREDLSPEKKLKFGISFTKCLIWQLLATEIIPGFCVYKIVNFARTSKFVLTMKNKKLSRWCPTLIGLGFIPFFPFTIDPIVDYIFLRLGFSLETDKIKL